MSGHWTASATRARGWRELYQKEDWWAVWVGLGLMALAIVLFASGSPLLKTLTINPGGLKWANFDQLANHFLRNGTTYLIQFVCWAAIFGLSLQAMGIPLSRFVPSFAALYLLSLVMFSVAGWVNAAKFNLEAPLVALVAGVVLANCGMESCPLPLISTRNAG